MPSADGAREGAPPAPSALRTRQAPLEMTPESFRALGHELVDRVAELLGEMRSRPVTPGESPSEVRAALGARPLPAQGGDAREILHEAAGLLAEHSLFNGHPRFFGYITSSAAPIGALGDLLAAAVNPNVGGWTLSPVATEIEVQTVRWIAELIGFPTDSGGLLVSGGNMANFVCFVAARMAKVPWDVRAKGIAASGATPVAVYVSKETHTWIQKAADLFGLGTDAVRWIDTDDSLRMDVGALRTCIERDRAAGVTPLMVVGTAGTVSTGAIDPLRDIATLCREQGLWFHVDGAYGAIAAALPNAPADLKALSLADSVAVDPHKWLYAPLEAGCALVRRPADLLAAFSYSAPYYHFAESGGEAPVNFFEHGFQNSRGFRALKVWLAMRQAGREGHARMVADDIRLAQHLAACVAATPGLELVTQGLSIVTMRYVPSDVDRETAEGRDYLNELNTALLERMQQGGEAFCSNAVVGGSFVLRACIVNFRTSVADVEALPEIVVRLGRAVHAEMRPSAVRSS